MDEGIKQLLIVAIAVIVGVLIINFISGNNGFISSVTTGITNAVGRITSAVTAAGGA